ncbi:MAG: hypothetical protein M3540_11385 [Actinomycetota bacterium]|nr:hypothetical protein [Actinomycetota bacterium]
MTETATAAGQTKPAARTRKSMGQAGAKAPQKAPEPNPFEQAIAGYHECVRGVIGRYEKRLEKLAVEYVDAADAASQKATAEGQQKAFADATERYNQGADKSTTESDKAIADCLKRFGTALQAAFAKAKDGSLDAATLAYIGSETLFIANAAAGAYPPAWWRPTAEKG